MAAITDRQKTQHQTESFVAGRRDEPVLVASAEPSQHEGERDRQEQQGGDVADQDVTVGIRPEGFVLDAEGPMHCKLNSVEVMGRDVSIVSTNEASLNPQIRSIINADNKVDEQAETVRYSLKAHKVFLFNKDTEERIHFEVK